MASRFPRHPMRVISVPTSRDPVLPSQKVGLGWVPGGSRCLLRFGMTGSLGYMPSQSVPPGTTPHWIGYLSPSGSRQVEVNSFAGRVDEAGHAFSGEERSQGALLYLETRLGSTRQRRSEQARRGSTARAGRFLRALRGSSGSSMARAVWVLGDQE